MKRNEMRLENILHYVYSNGKLTHVASIFMNHCRTPKEYGEYTYSERALESETWCCVSLSCIIVYKGHSLLVYIPFFFGSFYETLMPAGEWCGNEGTTECFFVSVSTWTECMSIFV